MVAWDLNPEPFVTRWSRRALTVGGVFALAALVARTFPILLLVAIALDLYRRRSWLSVRFLLFFCWYLFYYSAGVLGCGLVWIGNLPWVRNGFPERLAQATSALAVWWATGLYRGGGRIFGIRTDVEGDDLVDRGPFILFLRHASLIDVLLGLCWIQGPHGILLRHVLKSELLWDPCVDIAGHRWRNVFVRRGSGETAQELALLVKTMEDLGPKDGVLIYPEGTRFTPEKRERILASLKEKRPELYPLASAIKNLLPPRVAGPLALLDRNDAARADVLFCAHTGFEGTRHLRSFLSGSLLGAHVRIRFWRVPFAEIPGDRDARIAWIYDWWKRLDEWVGESAAWEDVSADRA